MQSNVFKSEKLKNNDGTVRKWLLLAAMYSKTQKLWGLKTKDPVTRLKKVENNINLT